MLLPELHAGPIDGVGLHRQVNRHLREVFTHQHDQAGVGHDQRVRAHLNHWGEVFKEGLQFGVMRGNVDHHIKLFALRMGLGNSQGQMRVIKLVIAHSQAVTRLPGIHRIRTIGEGVAHVFQGAGRGQQLRITRSNDHNGRLEQSKGRDSSERIDAAH